MAKIPVKKSVAAKSLQSISAKTTQASQFSSKVDATLQELFLGELKDTYWSENHLVKSIPKLVDAAGTPALKKALKKHLEVTRGHVTRLENVFDLLNEKIIPKKCPAMEGLTISGENIIENTFPNTSARDLGIIMASLKVENLEITTYQGLIELATAIGKPKAVDLLKQNMNEEENSKDILSDISTSLLQKKNA